MAFLSRYITFAEFYWMFGSGVPRIKFIKSSLYPDQLECVHPSEYHVFEYIIQAQNYFDHSDNMGAEVLDKEEVTRLYSSFSDYADVNTIRTCVKERREKTFSSCWFEQTFESYAMWRLYSDKKGAIVQCRKDELINALQNTIDNSKFNYSHCEVKYKSFIDRIENMSIEMANDDKSDYAYHKEMSFKHEEEYRFVIKFNNMNQSKVLEFNIDADLEFNIITHYKMEDWMKAMYREIRDRTNLKLDVMTSKLFYAGL